LFDCGIVAKVRPVLILSIPFADADRAVVTVVFHSTALRGSEFEIKIQVPFLKKARSLRKASPRIRSLARSANSARSIPRSSRKSKSLCPNGSVAER